VCCNYVAEYYYEWDKGGDEDGPVISGMLVRYCLGIEIYWDFYKNLPVHVGDFEKIMGLVESGDALSMSFQCFPGCLDTFWCEYSAGSGTV
jgi:hypothetical protein